MLSRMIPEFGPTSGRLPAGEHAASWEELVARTGFSTIRRRQLEGLLKAARLLASVGVTHIFVDGSFATKKHNPGDYDACYVDDGLDFSAIDPVLRDFSDRRKAMKAAYGGELFPANSPANELGEPFRTFFQTTSEGRPKGVIVLDLSTLPDD